jgi:hypothetical protein
MIKKLTLGSNLFSANISNGEIESGREKGTTSGSAEPDLIRTIEQVCARKMQPIIDNIRDMLISHEDRLTEHHLTLSKLAAKYKE